MKTLRSPESNSSSSVARATVTCATPLLSFGLLLGGFIGGFTGGFMGAMPLARAGLAFSPAVNYTTQKETDQSGILGHSDSKVMIIDFRLGYVFPENGLFLGGMYKLENSTYSNGDMKGFAVGPSLGYVNGGFSFIATYHFMGERKYTFSGVEAKFTDGKGYQFDLAWAPEVSPNFGLGPQLTYRTIKYAQSQNGTAAATSNSYEVTTIAPAFVFWFKF